MHIAVDSVRVRVKVIVGLIGRFMTLSFRTFSFGTGTIRLSRYGSLLEPIQYPVIGGELSNPSHSIARCERAQTESRTIRGQIKRGRKGGCV